MNKIIERDALHLIEEHESGEWVAGTGTWCEDAAKELRRLHEQNQLLLDALKSLVVDPYRTYSFDKARSAIRMVEGNA